MPHKLDAHTLNLFSNFPFLLLRMKPVYLVEKSFQLKGYRVIAVEIKLSTVHCTAYYGLRYYKGDVQWAMMARHNFQIPKLL